MAWVHSKYASAEIIGTLRKTGHVVAPYMGDEINDAPALYTTDVDTSVDTAVDVAKVVRPGRRSRV